MDRRQFLCGAALSLCAIRTRAALRRRRHLLLEDSRPPLFTLPDSAGRPVSLRPFLGEKRIALVFRPSLAYLDEVLAIREQFQARDLIVLAVGTPAGGLKDTTAGKPLYVLTDSTGATLRAYGAEGNASTFYLIGKDGTIKMARHGCPSNQTLFGTIDAMPMRRREMHDRGR